MWSAGCIFAEMFWRKPLFPGKDCGAPTFRCRKPRLPAPDFVLPPDVHQLKLILAVRGTPPPEYLDRIGSATTKKFMKGLPHLNKTPLDQLFADASPVALDLLDRMLAWRPEDRLTVEGALAHPYFASYHNPEEEYVCPPFDHSFEERLQDVTSLRGERGE
jgi:serine/threonine protein kinase